MSIRVHSRLTRCCGRRLARSLGRRTTRRLGGRGPNYLAQAFAAFRRSIRAHRKLIELAPGRFDRAVRERRARARAEEDRRDAEWSKAIAQAYGVSEAEAAGKMHQARMNSRGGNGAEMGRFSRKQKQDIERWEAVWQLWLALGREAFERHNRHQPHRWLSLGTIARLLELSSALGRLSQGMPWPG